MFVDGVELTDKDLAGLSQEGLADLAKAMAAWRVKESQSQFFRMFPAEDTKQSDGSMIYARSKYAKHLEFFGAGADYRERCAMCANRVGKTYGMGAYETTCHLTGLYPDWWPGYRFTKPIRAWAAGKTNETTRDIVQTVLLGSISFDGARKTTTGTGMVPGYLLANPSWKQGVQDLVDNVQVQHISGGWSTLGLKSYQQGRGSFEGTSQDWVWLDEEPPIEVYGEVVIRTATTNGRVAMTFTPLEGLSDTVMQFIAKDETAI